MRQAAFEVKPFPRERHDVVEIRRIQGEGLRQRDGLADAVLVHEVVGASGVVSHIVVGNTASIRVAERPCARARDAGVQAKGMPVRVHVYPDAAGG